MKLLLDTHILIWASARTLPQEAVPFIANADNILLFSPASIWEVVIKKGLGRSDFNIDPAVLRQGLLERGYVELDITSRHVLATGDLPPLHKDPFDRLLIAQARSEEITLLTVDVTVARYDKGIICIKK
ncbi:MAG: type II toxin-antitoxin system VapC family toxin [Treponema sp.]|jgi:PIN domain nuclease of toxin-antitoxin system|nr:type II toxin-antitoxin system VapC family toxin [Treponema sp.]